MQVHRYAAPALFTSSWVSISTHISMSCFFSALVHEGASDLITELSLHRRTVIAFDCISHTHTHKRSHTS